MTGSEFLVLGAGLSGLSASYHLGHDRCLILEASDRAFGHIGAQIVEGFTWDPGPHVSFTKNDYVRSLLAGSVGGDYLEVDVRVRNYYQGHWIEHPVQSHLYQVPEPERSRCLDGFLTSRADAPAPRNYAEWLSQAFGRPFADRFPRPYTRKYWTTEPEHLTTAWVGDRVFRPSVQDVVRGAQGPLGRPTHYITQVRYPRRGGFESFARGMASAARIIYGARVVRIDLAQRRAYTAGGECFAYQRLISTVPLPVFVEACEQATPEAIDAANALQCTELLLVNVVAPHSTRVDGHWFYVYDEEKLSTRINCIEALSPYNSPQGHTGVQVEVYASSHRPWPAPHEEIADYVVAELGKMGFLDAGRAAWRTGGGCLRWCPHANVIFDHDREPALECIFSFLEEWGLVREEDELAPTTDWKRKLSSAPTKQGTLHLAGRFGQWKYYWSDDCVLRGMLLGQSHAARAWQPGD